MSKFASENKILLSCVMNMLDGKAKLLMEDASYAFPKDHIFTRLQLEILEQELPDSPLRNLALKELLLKHLSSLEFGAYECEPILKKFSSLCTSKEYQEQVFSTLKADREKYFHEICPYRTDDVKLNLHIFSPQRNKAKHYPCVLFLFGGGWYIGSPDQFFPFCTYLAKKGYVAITADYRTKGRVNVPPVEGLKDVKSAIRYIRKHAETLNIDAGRIGVTGWSAGGHLGAASALISNFNHTDDDPGISCCPNAVIMMAPGLDVISNDWFCYVNGCSVDPVQLSPRHCIGRNAPPMYIVVGDRDEFADFKELELFTNKMKRMQNICEYEIIKGLNHTGLLSKQICNKIDRFLKKIFS